MWLMMVISYNWLFLREYTFYFHGVTSVLVTGKESLITPIMECIILSNPIVITSYNLNHSWLVFWAITAVSRKWRNYPLVIKHAHICTEMIAPLTLSKANDSELLAYGISLALLLPAVYILYSFSVLINDSHMHNYIWANIWNWYGDGSRQANLGLTRVSGFKLIRKWWLSWKAHWTRLK